MTDQPVKARRVRRPRVDALVVRSWWLKTGKDRPDLWAGRHVVVNEMTCSHQLRAITNRLLLRGERRRCKFCERAIDQAAVPLPFEGR